jgi:hypothetical protein
MRSAVAHQGRTFDVDPSGEVVRTDADGKFAEPSAREPPLREHRCAKLRHDGSLSLRGGPRRRETSARSLMSEVLSAGTTCASLWVAVTSTKSLPLSRARAGRRGWRTDHRACYRNSPAQCRRRDVRASSNQRTPRRASGERGFPKLSHHLLSPNGTIPAACLPGPRLRSEVHPALSVGWRRSKRTKGPHRRRQLHDARCAVTAQAAMRHGSASGCLHTGTEEPRG